MRWVGIRIYEVSKKNIITFFKAKDIVTFIKIKGLNVPTTLLLIETRKKGKDEEKERSN